MKRHSNSKELNKVIKEAKKQRWVVVKTKKNHIKWVNPQGEVVYSACTPSDFRAIKNILEDLKRRGFVTQ